MRSFYFFGLMLTFALSCNGQALEKEFFRQPLATRVERLRRYPLEEQYRIFRYGMDKREPAMMELADPIAARGGAAVPFLVKQLNSKPDDLAVRDILLIFETMASSKTYDVRHDAVVMLLLNTRVSGIKDPAWRRICAGEVAHIDR